MHGRFSNIGSTLGFPPQVYTYAYMLYSMPSFTYKYQVYALWM